MCTNNLCFRAKKEKYYTVIHLKINIFTAVNYCCILHGRVCIMTRMINKTRLNIFSALLEHLINSALLFVNLCLSPSLDCIEGWHFKPIFTHTIF